MNNLYLNIRLPIAPYTTIYTNEFFKYKLTHLFRKRFFDGSMFARGTRTVADG